MAKAFLDGGWHLVGKTVSRTALRIFTIGHSNRSAEGSLWNRRASTHLSHLADLGK